MPGTPLVNYSPAMFPHDYKGMSAGSLQVTSAASPSLSSLTPAFNSYNPYNFRSNLNHLTPSISSVNNITSVGAGSPLSFSVSHPTSSPSTLSLLGTVGGMLGSNQTNEGANWRNRNVYSFVFFILTLSLLIWIRKLLLQFQTLMMPRYL